MAKYINLLQAVQAKDCAKLQELFARGIDINYRDSMRRTLLHYAVEHSEGDTTIIELLVDLGANINARDIQGKTPLHYIWSKCPFVRKMGRYPEDSDFVFESLVESRQITIVTYLIEQGADVNTTFVDGSCLSMFRAIRGGNIHLLDLLIRLGVQVNAPTLMELTALQQAGIQGKLFLVKQLVELGADVNAGYNMIPPIHQAVQSGRLDMMQLLVAAGADVNVNRIDNIKQLYLAISRRLPVYELVECLLQLGADANETNSSISVLDSAVSLQRIDMVEYLARNGANVSPAGGMRTHTLLGTLVSKQDKSLVSLFLKYGADPNLEYSPSITPLAVAARLGNHNLVRTLVKHGAKVNEEYLVENTTPLYQSVVSRRCVIELLVEHGGDINRRIDFSILPLHDAVRRGDTEMVKTLAELGADMNKTIGQGMSMFDFALYLPESDDNLENIKQIIKAGMDLNIGHADGMTVVHDAVRLRDREMVRTLANLHADMNGRKTEDRKPIHFATLKGRKDVISYLATIGADMNAQSTADVRPLHDAVRLGDMDMVQTLVESGAGLEYMKQSELSALNLAIMGDRSIDLLQHLIDSGVDVNSTSSRYLTVFYDAIKCAGADMIILLMDLLDNNPIPPMIHQFSLLNECIAHCNLDAVECLLKCGVDKNLPQNFEMSTAEYALNLKEHTKLKLLVSFGEDVFFDEIGTSPLHLACGYGFFNLVRLLIIEGSNLDASDYNGIKPLDYLPLADFLDYSVLKETVHAENVVEKVNLNTVSVVGCQDMATVLHRPGIGNVCYISYPNPTEISERIIKLLERIPNQCSRFSEGQFLGIGSAAEGTKVGIPDEMDFMFKLPIERFGGNVFDAGNGYMYYDYMRQGFRAMVLGDDFKERGIADPWQFKKGSVIFHTEFTEDIRSALTVLSHANPDEKVSLDSPQAPIVQHTDRKACSPLRVKWLDKKSHVYISIDLVPSLHINDWPEGAITQTWLMNYEELRSRGYVLVPKPPHTKSDLAKKYTADELQSLWKISFPHLETEHMQRLDQRIKNVYLTAKSLRNPDVCRIMIMDDGSFPRNVDKYITSYLLKMMFFKNVEYFLQADLGLGEMVCKVYEDLEQGLSEGFIPLFFLPKVDALGGIKLDVSKSAKVANIMKRFVRALYQLDSGNLKDEISHDIEEVTVYQRRPTSVYRTYDIGSC